MVAPARSKQHTFQLVSEPLHKDEVICQGTLDKETRPLRVGSQANVMVYSSNNIVMNALGYIRMRLVALLTYVQ